MKILHVLSQLQPTGSEFFAATLADEQIARGHEVHIISDNLFAKTLAQYTPFAMGDRSLRQRKLNIHFLRTFIIKNKIDVLHCHSRAASWVGQKAVKGTSAIFLSSIHGRQHIHFSSKIKDIYGKRLLVVCENLRQHLSQELNIDPAKIYLGQNAVTFSDTLKESRQIRSQNHEMIEISIIGRTTGPKGENTARLICEVFPILLKEFNRRIKINIIGGDEKNLGQKALEVISALKTTYPDQFNVVGFTSELNTYLLRSDIVIASGRSAMESLHALIPTMALGEAGYEGLVTLSSFEKNLNSNFADISEKFQSTPHLPVAEILQDLKNCINNMMKTQPVVEKNDIFQISKLIQDHFSVEQVSEKVLSHYRSLLFEKKFPTKIPILMYHKTPDGKLNSKHRIFVTQKKLAQHFRFFKFFGFTPIGFADYQNLISGKTPVSQFPKKPIILSFDDGYLDNYKNALPLIKQFGFKIILYALANPAIKTNFWDAHDPSEPESPLMNLSQLKDFVSAGVEIGSHGSSHGKYTEMPIDEVKREMQESKKYLEENLGVDVISMAYPFGLSNPQVQAACRDAGYEFAVTTDIGGISIEDDRFQIFRINVFPEDNWLSLIKKTSIWYRFRFFRKRAHLFKMTTVNMK